MADNFTIVQLVLMDETGDSFYRMRWPARDLAQQQTSWRIINLDARSPRRYKFAEEADLLVLYQSNDIDLLPIIKKRRASGKKTIVEYNDNFYAPPASSPVAEHWRSPLLWQVYEAFMREADALIVTGHGLKELFSEKTEREIFIIENHLPYKPQSKLKDLSSINIGWAGSLGHVADLLTIAPTIRGLLEKDPRVTFYLMGNVTLPEILDIPKERMKFVPWGGMNEYYSFLDNLHIGLAPLLETPYNRCRSDIKAVEIASSSTLPVLTDLLPYHDFIKNTGAPCFKSLQELANLLTEIIKDTQRLQKGIQDCFNYVSKERVGLDKMERQKIYSSFAPRALSSFSWGYNVGYHEVIDEPENENPTAKYIKEMEIQLKAQNRDKARSVLEKGMAENEFSIDLALIKATRFFESEATSFALFEKIEKHYPGDLRIPICKALLTRNEHSRIEAWKSVFTRYEKEGSTYKEFFSIELARRFAPEIARGGEFVELGEKLVKLIPHAINLRLSLVEIFRRSGDPQKALLHIEYILDYWKVAQFNQKLMKDLPESYLASLKDAMHARSKDKLIS